MARTLTFLSQLVFHLSTYESAQITQIIANLRQEYLSLYLLMARKHGGLNPMIESRGSRNTNTDVYRYLWSYNARGPASDSKDADWTAARSIVRRESKKTMALAS